MSNTSAEQQIGKAILKYKNSLPEQARKDVEQHLPKYERLIYKMARKYIRNRVEFDDLVQEALYGLMLACRDFNPERSRDFHTYAIYRMKGRMYAYCIRNESPIHIPTQVAKAASYVKQMQNLLSKEPYMSDKVGAIPEVIGIKVHAEEVHMTDVTVRALKELKRKLGSIASNSETTYATLSSLAMQSLSLIVSDEVLTKHPKETCLVEDTVARQEIVEALRTALGEKKYTVISMRSP